MTQSLYSQRPAPKANSLDMSTKLAVMRNPTSHGNNRDDIVPVVHEGPDPDGGSHGPNQDDLRSMTGAHAEARAE